VKGADPWLEYYDGNYYLVTTTFTGVLGMRKSRTLAGLATAPSVQIWSDTTPTRNANISTVHADPHEAARTDALVRRTDGDEYFLTLTCEGSGTVRQEDRAGTMGPGDFALVDSARPYAFRWNHAPDLAVRPTTGRGPHHAAEAPRPGCPDDRRHRAARRF
jgi:hypothetical protein